MYYYSTKHHSPSVPSIILSLFVIMAILLTPLSPILADTEIVTEPEVTNPLTPTVSELPETTTVIATGEAISGADVTSVINLNETTNTQDLSTSVATTTEVDNRPSGVYLDTTTEGATENNQPSDKIVELSQVLSPEIQNPENIIDPTIISTTTNTAIVSNIIEVVAETGDNQTTGTSSVVSTGNAVAYANIVNVVNTNIFNSTGLVGFFNEVLGIKPLDLRSTFSVFTETETSESTTPCSPSICSSGEGLNTYINTNNDAFITNDVIVRAQTGNNEIGGGIIDTGNAYAVANLLNIANTNITDSNYLLLAFNNFGDYAEDIILPGAELINNLFSANGSSLESINSSSTNLATIENTLSTGAETGTNELTSGAIITGDAFANSSVHNVVNTNLFGDNDFLLVLRVHGDWSGKIFGLPEGIAWTETEHGITLYNTNSNQNYIPGGYTSVMSNNYGEIKNNVSVYALTGDNKAGENGIIKTGDAYSATNITNVANTNILGQNWALLVFDIFGDWSGNIAFGRPDLWIGGKATSLQDPILPGSEVEYTYTITNHGDATATDVKLNHFLPENQSIYLSAPEEILSDDRGKYGNWNIGNLAPKETKEVHITTKVSDQLGQGKHEIISKAVVSSLEPDANETDNTELLSILAGKQISYGGSRGNSAPANLEVIKTANVNAVNPGGSVDYTITVTNKGGPLYKALVHDRLANENGTTSSEQYWDLGTIRSRESITLTYTMEFAEDATSGQYKNMAEVTGFSGNNSTSKGKAYTSKNATHTITIGEITPTVLGAMTSNCTPYLTTYMKYGQVNDATEVAKLQAFLKTHLGSNLAVTGNFDLMTEIAVRDFQQLYANEILYPWGLKRDSGVVYYTTQKKINEINCGTTSDFPLTLDQIKEMVEFKKFVNQENYITAIADDSASNGKKTIVSLIEEPVKLNDPPIIKQVNTSSPFKPIGKIPTKKPFKISLQLLLVPLFVNTQ